MKTIYRREDHAIRRDPFHFRKAMIIQVESFEPAPAGNEPEIIVIAGDYFSELVARRFRYIVKYFAENNKLFSIISIEAILRSKPEKASFINGDTNDTTLRKTFIDTDIAEQMPGLCIQLQD